MVVAFLIVRSGGKLKQVGEGDDTTANRFYARGRKRDKFLVLFAQRLASALGVTIS